MFSWNAPDADIGQHYPTGANKEGNCLKPICRALCECQSLFAGWTENAFFDTKNVSMKTLLTVFSRHLFAGGLSATFLFAGLPAPAAVVGPYLPDAATLHLWHLDETAIPLVDSVVGGLSLNAAGNGATLGNASLPGFGAAVSTIDGGQSGIAATDKDAYVQPVATVNAAGDNINWSFADPVTGAFTFEALVRINFDPAANLGATAAGGNNRNAPLHIIGGEQDGTGGGVRSWQFRLDPIGFNPNAGGITTPLTQPTLEFISVNNGAVPLQFIFAPLPITGPDAIVQGQWYHVAAAYDGTNNTPDNFKIYWTLADNARSEASLLVSSRLTNDLVVGAVDFSIGNIGRGTPNGNFIGLVDEVRISSVARSASQMIFGASDVAPAFVTSPQNQFVEEGGTVNMFGSASGTQPVSYQWQQDEVDLPGQTNQMLTLSGVTSAAAGAYRLIAGNAAGSATSDVARVTLGVRLGDIYGTGVDDARVLLPGASVDPHYRLVASDDIDFPGPLAIVFNEGVPVTSYVPNGPASKWIGPRLNTNAFPGNVAGTYVYRHEFVIDTTDPAGTALVGRWGSDNDGFDIRLNGVSLGIRRLVERAFDTLAPFTISTGLVSGLNTIEFVVSNRPPTGATALRVDLLGIGLPLAPGLPVIAGQPANRTFVETDTATLSVIARGAPPLTYQWYRGDTLLSGQTHRSLRLTNSVTADSGSYLVVVSNGSGSVTSEVVTLTVKLNDPPTAGGDGVVTALQQPVSFPVSRLLANDSDPDGQTLRVIAIDSASVLTGAISVSNQVVTFTPFPFAFADDVDTFSYTISDGFGGTAVGTVEVRHLDAPVPSLNRVVIVPVAGGYALRYFGDSNQAYRIVRSETLGGAPAVGPETLATITSTAHGLVEYTDNAPLPGRAFYRVVRP